MSADPPEQAKPAATAAPAEDRRAREAAALRENLRKRKDQARARAEPPLPRPRDPAADPAP